MAQPKTERTIEKFKKPLIDSSNPFTSSERFNDDLQSDYISDATWKEVCIACCVHTPRDWAFLSIYLCGVAVLLYWFVFSLELLGTGAKVLTGCVTGALFGDNINPIAGVMVGILSTVLLQSSSTTTSIIVSLVGSGAISVEPAIFMVMGSNVGTSLTNTIVAVGQMGDGEQLERAFAGATIHDTFNYLALVILLPVEAATNYLAFLSRSITSNWEAATSSGVVEKGGIKDAISPILNLIIMSNTNVIDQVANGAVENCSEYYPVYCVDGVESYNNCVTDGRIGLITCDENTNKCPLFFQSGASKSDDQVSGCVTIFLGIICLVSCLMGLVFILQKLLLGTSTRIIYKATNLNGFLSMLIGAGTTILVQSSSVTTSCLTPLVGLGVIRLEQMFPLTLGANLGTTFTALMAAYITNSVASLQVALAHFFFNLTGIAIWYPIPYMRQVPMNAARALGKATKWWKGFPILYISIVFFAFPLVLLGISFLLRGDSIVCRVLGSVMVMILVFGCLYLLYWWYRKDGKQKTMVWMKALEHKKDTKNAPVDPKHRQKENALVESDVEQQAK